MMPKSVRKEINLQREKEGKEMFANTRNATAGSIKLLDSGEVAKRGLVCFVYDILSIGDSERDPQEYDISSFNFPNVDLKKQPTSISEIKKLCLDPATKTQLAQQDFDFDGLVIKLFDKQSRSLLGSTNHHPRRAIAYKFPAEQASTQILSVDFQVGRSGIITPVANLEPVKLSGVEISRVSLHNFDFIKEKEIKKSDFIWIQRSGEVIPYITSVIKNRRNGSEELIEPPLFCPSCQAPIINIDIHYYCTNPNCPAQIKEKILHFASKNAMDIQGLGDTIIETLVNRGLLHNVADLYHLEDPKLRVLLRKFPGFGDRKIYEITKGIKASKEQPFRRLLNALGIPHVGIKTAQDITNFLKGEKADSLMKIQSLLIDPEKMVALPGIGEKIILTLQNFFSNPQTQALLEKLQNYGVNFSAVNAFEENKGALGSFSLTGKFPFPKEQIIEVLEKL
jgi:DNA ligase (NAD+)